MRGTLGPGLNVGLSAGVTYLYQTESSSGFHRVHSEMNESKSVNDVLV